MWKQFVEKIRNMDTIIKQITKKGFHFSFLVCLISIFILITYHNYASPDLYYIGVILFKTSLYFAIEFFICGFVFDTIKKQIV